MRRLFIATILSLVLMVPTVSSAQDDSAAASQFLADAVAATGALSTFHFKLEHEKGKTVIDPGIEVRSAEGDIERPDSLAAKAALKALFVKFDIKIISVAGRLWTTNPLGKGSKFEERDVDPALVALANPDTIVLLIPELIDNPVIEGVEEIDGKQLTRVVGNVNLSRLAEIAPAVDTSDLNTTEPLIGTIYVDENGIVNRIRIKGKFLTRDKSDVVRVITLSKFDEPVDIQPPA